jgi:hypothetical protein
MDTQKITDKIATLQRAVKTSPTQVLTEKLKTKISELRQVLKDTNVTTTKLATTLLASQKKVAGYSKDEFNGAIKRLSARDEYTFLKGMSKGKVKDDLKRFAKPVGWRFKGRFNIKKPNAKELAIGKKNGTVYYEDRRDRSDVVRPARLKTGGSVDGIKITKNEFQFRKDEPNRVYHWYEGTLGDYIFYAQTDNSFKNGYGSDGINKGSIYKLSIRKVLDSGMHDSIAEYWNKWDYKTKNAKDGAIRSKIIKYIDSISDEKNGTPKEYKYGGNTGSKKYKLGDGYSSDFDYDGMLEMGLKANVSWGEAKLRKLYDSFEDVNYHTAIKPLWSAINYLKNGRNSLAKLELVEFHKLVENEITGEDDQYGKGGGVNSENAEMVLNNNKQIAHHTKELQSAVKGKNVPAWVVAKVNRSASDLSDATHYLDGSKYNKGGNLGWATPQADYLSASDWQDLASVKEQVDAGNYDYAMKLASSLDTIVRDEIPLDVWVKMGGTLTKSGQVRFDKGEYGLGGNARVSTMPKEQYERMSAEIESHEMKNGGGINAVIDKQVHADNVCKKHNCTLEDYNNAHRKYGMGGALIVAGLGIAGIIAYNNAKKEAMVEDEYKVKLYKKGTLQDTVIFPESYVLKAKEDYSNLGYVVRVAKIKKMKTGGGVGIPNNYLGKSADEVWNNWTETQRMHFLLDHQVLELHPSKVMISFKELPTKVRVELIEHISEGQYALGGGVGDEISIATKYGKMLNEISKEKQFNKKIELNSQLNQFAKQNEISIDNNNIIYIKGNKVAYIDKLNSKTGQSKINWIIKKYAKGGGVEEYKLKDVVDFYYGRKGEEKVVSGTITDILNDGYTISTSFTQVKVMPSEIIGYTKQAEPKKKRFGIFKNGGEIEFIEYKDEEIMYEPNSDKYYANDEEFDTLKEAQNYIDGGSPMSAKTINAYRHGAFKKGGSVEKKKENNIAKTGWKHKSK